MDINCVVVCGDVDRIQPALLHECCYYEAVVSVRRLSGIKDKVTILAKEEIPSGHIRVCGELRSRRVHKRLEIYVYAQRIEKVDVCNENECVVEGFVCSDPFYKKTINKELSQFMLCIDGCRKSYVSVLVWEPVEYKQGDRIAVTGRLQSRRFVKDGKVVEVNELSAHKKPLFCQQK